MGRNLLILRFAHLAVLAALTNLSYTYRTGDYGGAPAWHTLYPQGRYGHRVLSSYN